MIRISLCSQECGIAILSHTNYGGNTTIFCEYAYVYKKRELKRNFFGHNIGSNSANTNSINA